jgi:histidinol-phosphate aminotransferase
MRTLSKVGLAGLRIGYLIADPAIVRHIEKVRPPYNLGSINQRAAVWLLTNYGELIRERCDEIKSERANLHSALGALPGVRVYDSEANLILFRVDGAPGVWRALAARGVLVRKFGGLGNLACCLRVTVGTADENRLFLAALTEVLS